MSPDKNQKLVLTVAPQPRLWLAPSRFNKSLFGQQPTPPAPPTETLRLFLKKE